jgi:3-oxoacyl-ACP reductase-like protein
MTVNEFWETVLKMRADLAEMDRRQEERKKADTALAEAARQRADAEATARHAAPAAGPTLDDIRPGMTPETRAAIYSRLRDLIESRE